jgi:hypothetical protein
LFVLFSVLSVLIGSFSLSWVAQEVRDEEPDLAYTLRLTGRSWLRLVVLLGLGSLALFMLIIGISLVYSILAALAPQLGALVLTAMAIGLVWLSVYAGIILFFAPRAMILDDMGIVRSLWNSVNVVRGNLLSTLFLILLVGIIQNGLMYIWRLLAVNAVGTMAGIVGNAYVSTGLVTSSLIFYRDRFVAWQEKATMGEGQP